MVACIRVSFLFKAEQYSIIWINHIWFLHSHVGGLLGCIHFLAILNSATMNSVQVL